ncbi:hypothetical protein BGW39_001425 [Mortierella sp. 14UC]|nr:hypothetical protein BGW39_001425 [Mortierella sp. 14UC]
MFCTRTTKAVVAGTPAAGLLAKTLLPALASSSRARIHTSAPRHAAASAAAGAETNDNNNTNSNSNNIPNDIDTPLPMSTQSKKTIDNRKTEAAYFNDQKRRLLTSMDMLYQIQDAPAEKLDATPLDDQEAQYWARRMDTAMTDLEQEQTRLRVAVIGESSGQDSIMDLLLPSEQSVRRSAKDTGKVHRVRYGSTYSLQDSGDENIEKAPISWLEGLNDMDGGEIVEVPGLDLDDLTMDDIVYSSDLILFRTDAQRQLSLEREQHFLNRYRHKSHILVVADMNGADPSSETLTISNLKANLGRAVNSSARGYSNIQNQDSSIAKVLRISNPEPIPAIIGLTPRAKSETRYMETVGALQRLVASTLILEGHQDYHRREALLRRCRDLMTSAIENMETRLDGRLETFAQVDKLSELATEEIKRIETEEHERMIAQVTDGEVDKDVRQMRRVLDHFFKSEVPFWMLFARSGEISERMHELWTAGAFAETEHRIKDKDVFVVSNIVWKHRTAYGTLEHSLAAGRPGALERLQRRGQVALAQGLGLQGTAVFTGLGLAQQYPPEVYLTSGTMLALAGLGYMQVRWKAAENEFKAEAESLADQLKQDIVDTYQEQVKKTIVKPLTAVVQTLDNNLGVRLLRSLEQRKVLTGIKRDAKGEDEIEY